MPPCSTRITHHHPTQSGCDGAAGGGADTDAQPSAYEEARATLHDLRSARPFTAECAGGCAERGFAEAVRTGAWSNSSPSSASVRLPGRAWRLWAARHSQGGETGPLGAQPLPRVLERAASKAADPTVSVSTQTLRMCRANAPASVRGIGRRGRGCLVPRCTPPVNGNRPPLQSKATSSLSRAWAPSETCALPARGGVW